MTLPAAAIPPAIGTGLKLETGEILLVPAELNGAIDKAWRDAVDQGADAGEWRTAFGNALVVSLHLQGFILVARARQKSRESVNADIYSLALAGKYSAESRLEALLLDLRVKGRATTKRVIALTLAAIVAVSLVYNALCCGLDDRGHLAATLIIVGTTVTTCVAATRAAYSWLTRRDASRRVLTAAKPRGGGR